MSIQVSCTLVISSDSDVRQSGFCMFLFLFWAYWSYSIVVIGDLPHNSPVYCTLCISLRLIDSFPPWPWALPLECQRSWCTKTRKQAREQVSCSSSYNGRSWKPDVHSAQLSSFFFELRTAGFVMLDELVHLLGGKVRDSLEIPFGDGTQSAGAAYYSSSMELSFR